MTSISSVNFTAGPAATGAGKTLSCANNAGWVDCVLFGVNATAIPNGVVATAAVTVLAGTTASTAPLGVTNPASTNTSAGVLPTVGTGGAISIVQVPSTWSISGLISQGSGATMTLSGAASRTATADALGNYSFTGLLNGSYTVSAAKTGFAIAPASQAVTISGANVGGVSFSATQTTWTISGNIASGSGATVSLGGAATRTVTADASGNYSFPGLLNGSYTVAPSKAAMTFTPTARVVTVSGLDQSAMNFTGVQQGTTTPTVDTTVWTDRSQSSTSFVSPMFSTNKSNELLLAFVATDSTSGVETIRSVSGAGLSWTLVKRTNTQRGTSEIWRAFAESSNGDREHLAAADRFADHHEFRRRGHFCRERSGGDRCSRLGQCAHRRTYGHTSRKQDSIAGTRRGQRCWLRHGPDRRSRTEPGAPVCR
jgi:hypothetical protein